MTTKKLAAGTAANKKVLHIPFSIALQAKTGKSNMPLAKIIPLYQQDKPVGKLAKIITMFP